MLKLIVRFALLLIGVVFLIDAVLPLRTERLQVDQHTSVVAPRTTSVPYRSWGDTTYTLHLVGGVVSSCSVGFSAYTGLYDGDTVSVESTRLFRYCIGISKDAKPVEAAGYWRLWVAFVACVLIAAAVGWIGIGSAGNIPGE